MDLWVRKTTSKEFKNRIEEIYKNSEEIFKDGGKNGIMERYTGI